MCWRGASFPMPHGGWNSPAQPVPVHCAMLQKQPDSLHDGGCPGKVGTRNTLPERWDILEEWAGSGASQGHFWLTTPSCLSGLGAPRSLDPDSNLSSAEGWFHSSRGVTHPLRTSQCQTLLAGLWGSVDHVGPVWHVEGVWGAAASPAPALPHPLVP